MICAVWLDGGVVIHLASSSSAGREPLCNELGPLRFSAESYPLLQEHRWAGGGRLVNHAWLGWPDYPGSADPTPDRRVCSRCADRFDADVARVEALLARQR